MSIDDPNEEEVKALYSRIKKLEAIIIRLYRENQNTGNHLKDAVERAEELERMLVIANNIITVNAEDRSKAFTAGLEAAAKVAKEAEFLDCVIDKQLATAELILKLKDGG